MHAIPILHETRRPSNKVSSASDLRSNMDQEKKNDNQQKSRLSSISSDFRNETTSGASILQSSKIDLVIFTF